LLIGWLLVARLINEPTRNERKCVFSKENFCHHALVAAKSFDKRLVTSGIVVAAAVVGILVWLTYGGVPGITSASAELPRNQRISQSTLLRFAFPFSMDRKSVEESLIMPDGMKGQGAWDGNIYVFDPSVTLELGKTYIFTLPRKAKRSNGTLLNEDIDFRFTVAGEPVVAARMPPENATEAPRRGQISIVFDRPMVALTTIAAKEGAMSDWPVTIEPEIPGRWKWISTTTAQFSPSEDFAVATRYSVKVPAGISSLLGEKTTKDFSWTFSTVRPRLLSSTPEDGFALAGPTTAITLRFSEEMNLASVREHVILQRTSIKQAADSRKPMPGEHTGLGEFEYGKKLDERGKETPETDKRIVVVTTEKPLLRSSAYALTLAAGARAVTGDLGVRSGSTLRFSTVGDFTFDSAAQQYGEVVLNFSNPVDAKTLSGHITITPKPANWEFVTTTVNDWYDGREARLSPELLPSTTYTVTVDATVKDTFGQKVANAKPHTFKTDPLRPAVHIRSKGAFGIFEKDKAPVYYVNAVNVGKLDLSFASLTLPEFLAIRSSSQNYSAPVPNLSRYADYQAWNVVPKAKNNEWKETAVDLEKTLGRKLVPGIYAFIATAPEYRSWDEREQLYEQQYFMLTNMSVTLKYSGNHALVWVTDTQTGLPVADALIAFHTLDGVVVITGLTNREGFFEADIDIRSLTPTMTYRSWDPEFWVSAEKDGDIAYVGSMWNTGIQPWDFGVSENFRGPSSPKQNLFAMLTTDRPLYRAGDTVHIKGTVRLLDEQGKLVVPNSTHQALFKITDANYKEIFSRAIPLSEFGTFRADIPLAKDASLGSYGMTVMLTPDDLTGDMRQWSSFDVLAYRKPEYRVDLAFDKEEYHAGDALDATIEGAYYFGAPMEGTTVEWWANSSDYYFNKVTDEWYSFGPEDAWCFYGCSDREESIATGKGKLDDDGKLAVRFPVTLDTKKLSQVISLEANVYDPNNQVVSNRTSVPVHKSGVYVGIRTKDYVVRPGTPGTVELITVDTEGKPVQGQSVTVKLFSRTWNTVRKKGVDGEYYYDNTSEDTFVAQTQARTDEKGKAEASLVIPSGGSYVFTASTKDNGGRTSLASSTIYSWSSTYINWPHENNDRVEVLADKPEYKAGDTAKLLVKSPYQGKGVKALITVERENIIRRQVIDIESTAQSISVPITEDLIPEAYVSVVLVKPRQGETFDEEGKDTGIPAFKVGYVRLNVATSPKKLDVEIGTDKKRYGPGEEVEVTLNVKDATGKGVRADISLSVVDMSVLALSGFATPDPLAYFYSNRGLGVHTAQMLLYMLERMKPGSKGGGGGGPDRELRGTFKDTAYWHPSIRTDDQGRATVKFKLPDNLTTWKLIAIANTKESTFGAGTVEIIETKQVIVRPVRPRFAVRGDEMQFGAIVHNFLGEKATFTVTLAGSGFTMLSPGPKTVTLSGSGQQKVLFPIRIGKGNAATFRVLATDGSHRDEIEETIPVVEFSSPQTVATSGTVQDDVTEQVGLPRETENAKLAVTVSPTVASYLDGSLSYLVDFPYGCAEQTASSFLPNVMLSRLAGYEQFAGDLNKKKINDKVLTGIQKLYGFQRSDGGFGFWNDSPRSYTYLTAYILFALREAKKSRYAVDANVLKNAEGFLLSALRSKDLMDEIDDTTRTYIVFVLAEGGSYDRARLDMLYSRRASLPVFAKAYLAMALQKAAGFQTSERAMTVLNEAIATAKVDARGAHFEEHASNAYWLHTNVKTTAVVLQALMRIQPGHTLIPNILRHILYVRKDGRWDTTQSTISVLLAFTDYLRQSGELESNLRASVEVNAKKILEENFSGKNLLTRKSATVGDTGLNKGGLTSVMLSKEGQGTLYYDLVLSYDETGDSLPALEEGMAIQRAVEPLKGSPVSPAVGGTYKVTLTITVPVDRHFVAVESPLPAGFEPVDFKLQTAQQGLSGEVNDAGPHWWESSLWYFNHTEMRDDRVFLFADTLPAGTYTYEYLMRATTPGTFHLRPAKAWEMYYPENFGQTTGEMVEVR